MAQCERYVASIAVSYGVIFPLLTFTSMFVYIQSTWTGEEGGYIHAWTRWDTNTCLGSNPIKLSFEIARIAMWNLLTSQEAYSTRT